MSKTRIKNEKALEEQIAFLRWRRMQNERQIRHSLEQTRSLQTKDELMRVAGDLMRLSGWETDEDKEENKL